MTSRRTPHDDETIRAARRKRERQLREEQRGEWDRFSSLTHSLVRIPKREIDEKRKTA